ncbi:helix-turn-helix domain-containing protein [Legionella sp. CNM-4043-24]|uniref:helix-turn-helix domain-containing protein n=1 Tax=Legionella sp. CNM-4043-24 TaxID=3421646 RepID=UPI00403AC55B
MSDLGESLLRGAMEALEYAKGNKKGAVAHDVLVPAQVDVMAIRKNMHMSRQKFCEEFGFSVRTLEKWERGERTPESSARAYLTVIASNPAAVITALHKEN